MEILIRPLLEEDAYTSVKWRNNPEVFKYTGNRYNHEITLDDELSWIRKVIQKEDDYRCAILADGKYVGNIYLTDINNSGATYHIFIGETEVWGKGVAKQASILILAYAFKQLNLKFVELHVRTSNRRAIELYKRLGFQEKFRDEEWIHMIITKETLVS